MGTRLTWREGSPAVCSPAEDEFISESVWKMAVALASALEYPG